MKSRASRFARVVLVIAGPVVLLAVGALTLVNLVLLPSALDTVVEAIEAQTDASVDYNSALYLPWSGITVYEISVDLPDDTQRVVVDEINVGISLQGALAARHVLANLPPMGLDALWRRAAMPDALERLADATRLFGGSLAGLGPVDVVVRSLRAGELTVGEARILHDLDTKMFRIDLSIGEVRVADGPVGERTVGERPAGERSFGPGAEIGVELDYGEGRARIELAAVDLVPFAGARAADLAVVLSFGPASGRAFAPEDGAPTRIEGIASLRGFAAEVPFVAAEAVGPLDVSFAFDAVLDPRADIENPADLPVLSRAGRLTDSPGMIREALRDAPAAQGELLLQEGMLSINGVELAVTGAAHGLYHGPPGSGRLGVPRWISTVMKIPTTPVDTIAGAVPDAVSGRLSRIRLDGDLALQMELRLVPLIVEAMDWRADVSLADFAVREIPADVNPYSLNDSFVHEIHDTDLGVVRRIEIPGAEPASAEWMLTHSEHTAAQIAETRARVHDARAEPPPRVIVRPDASGAGTAAPDPSYDYVRLDDMSPWVPAAVLTAEDGDFFFYPGVNPVTLKRAIAQNLQAGEILYGASTITMQLAKMLFLDEKRVFARKLQEVFLVYLMENHVIVPKDRILEIYLNIAEFGPGVYGISDAASYYFDQHPRDLGVGEAVWLASILPAPTSYHRYYDAGAISPGWFERMKSYMETMLVRGRISEAAYSRAVESPPTFAK